jgi:hypothetical protein
MLPRARLSRLDLPQSLRPYVLFLLYGQNFRDAGHIVAGVFHAKKKKRIADEFAATKNGEEGRGGERRCLHRDCGGLVFT